MRRIDKGGTSPTSQKIRINKQISHKKHIRIRMTTVVTVRQRTWGKKKTCIHARKEREREWEAKGGCREDSNSGGSWSSGRRLGARKAYMGKGG